MSSLVAEALEALPSWLLVHLRCSEQIFGPMSADLSVDRGVCCRYEHALLLCVQVRNSREHRERH